MLGRAKKKVKKSLATLGLKAPFISEKASILNYHRVCPDRSDDDSFDPNEALSVSISSFEEQMEYISKEFRCVSMDEFSEAIFRSSVPCRFLSPSICKPKNSKGEQAPDLTMAEFSPIPAVKTNASNPPKLPNIAPIFLCKL